MISDYKRFPQNAGGSAGHALAVLNGTRLQGVVDRQVQHEADGDATRDATFSEDTNLVPHPLILDGRARGAEAVGDHAVGRGAE